MSTMTTPSRVSVPVHVPGDPPVHLLRPIPVVDAAMLEYVRGLGLAQNLCDAIEYALLGGGKRLRPLLAWYCAVAAGSPTGGNADDLGQRSLPAGAAVEFIHAFSLVHDDLPGLDNDDTRRGRPTLHKATSVAMAVLAGDALLNLAYQVIVDRVPDRSVAAALVAELARGTGGMIVGQVYDTLGGFEPGTPAPQRVVAVHNNKTGALIRAACRMGAMCGGAKPEHLARITAYGEAIGLMFQIVDDIIDETGDEQHVGKKTKKDQDAGKLTYPGVLGLEGSRAEVRKQLDAAIAAVHPLGTAADPLKELATYLAVRTR